MRRSMAALGTGLAFALAFSASGQAQASTKPDGLIECYTDGAYGSLFWDRFKVGTTGEVSISLGLSDIASDGHHPEIRLVTEYYSGDKHYWPWHAYYDGSGSGYTWHTFAKDSDGMYEIGVQVANFEGNRLLNSKTCW